MASNPGLSLTKDEKIHLESYLETWALKSRAERSQAKEQIVAKFLQERQRAEDDEYARGFMLQVKYHPPGYEDA